MASLTRDVKPGDRLLIDDGILDGDTKSIYEVEITVSDFYGESVIQMFTIVVN